MPSTLARCRCPARTSITPPGRPPATGGRSAHPGRKLNPGRQALLVLAYLRMDESFAQMAAGSGIGIGIATA